MSVWSDIWDYFTDGRKPKKPDYDKEYAANAEKEMLDSIGEIAAEYNGESGLKLEDFMPKKEKFDYKNPLKLPEREDLEKLANAYYDAEKKNKQSDIDAKNAPKAKKLYEQNEDAIEKSFTTQAKADEAYIKSLKNLSNKLKSSNLASSSIAELSRKKIDEEKTLTDSNISEVFDQAANEIGEGFSKLERSKAEELANLEKVYFDKASDKLIDVTSKKQGEIEKVDSYNSSLAKKQAEYEKKLANAEKNYQTALEKEGKTQADYEAKYGKYYGAKGENYDRRVSEAYATYSQFPKEVAIELAKNNYELKKLLGNGYAELIKKLNKL